MSKTNEWKSKLISSGLPLEFEAAQVLVSKRFSLIADFTYARNDSGIVKDFSVDIDAVLGFDFTNSVMKSTFLDILVECKQRRPDTKWLFLPDPNRIFTSEISSFRDPIHAFDEFSFDFFPNDIDLSINDKIPVCYKGIEIGSETGIVHDSELKHGIAQLQYGLPRLLYENILASLEDKAKCSRKFFICPILLTTADLYIANPKLKTNDIEKSKYLDQIAKKVPYLMFFQILDPISKTTVAGHSVTFCIPRMHLQ